MLGHMDVHLGPTGAKNTMWYLGAAHDPVAAGVVAAREAGDALLPASGAVCDVVRVQQGTSSAVLHLDHAAACHLQADTCMTDVYVFDAKINTAELAHCGESLAGHVASRLCQRVDIADVRKTCRYGAHLDTLSDGRSNC